MYGPVVTSNKFQDRMRHTQNETLSPGTGTRHTAIGKIVEVFDQEKVDQVTVPEKIRLELEAYPGLLFARVQLDGGIEVILPFKEPEDQIYSTYGNSALLEGRSVKVEYEGMSVEAGQIILQRTFATKQLNLAAVGKTLDFGNII